jgi:hypothetical protein
MKHLRKSILTLLALTLFGGAGAWAQGPTNVTQFTTDMIASWEGVNEYVTLADLQALGFVAVDASVAQAWTGAPQNDNALLGYGFNEGNGYIMSMMFNHGNVNPPDQGSISKGDFYSMIAHGEKFFYTGAPNQAIELTKAGANQWTLGQAPDYDLELQVEYYEAHALKNIPAGWTVKVNGVEQQKPYQGDSLMITETDSVTLVPAGNPRRVKSVTLADEGPAVRTITVDGLQLNYVEGENWVQTADRNPDVLTTDSYYVFKMNSTIVLLVASQPVSPTSTYDPSLNYYWEQW